MIRNIGPLDRKIRAFVVAPVLVIAAIVLGVGTIGGIVALVLAAVMVATAAVRTCPLYLPFHISTDDHRADAH